MRKGRRVSSAKGGFKLWSIASLATSMSVTLYELCNCKCIFTLPNKIKWTWVCVTDRPGSFTSQSQCTPSPGFWLNKPAPHEHPHQAGYIITHLTSLQSPVSFIHWATFLPVYLPSVSPPVCSSVFRPNVCFGCHLLVEIIITCQIGVCCFPSQFHDLLWIKKQGYSYHLSKNCSIALDTHLPLPSASVTVNKNPVYILSTESRSAAVFIPSILFVLFFFFFFKQVYSEIMSLFSTFYFTFFSSI